MSGKKKKKSHIKKIVYSINHLTRVGSTQLTEHHYADNLEKEQEVEKATQSFISLAFTLEIALMEWRSYGGLLEI